MKKILIILLALVLLSGCETKIDEDVTIVAPTGAPAIAFYNEIDNELFETNNVPSNIVALMASASGPDIVVIDAVSGINAINNGANYSLTSIITFGNFYIASTGNDDNYTIDKEDTIVLFGQNQTPDLLFKYLYGNNYPNLIYENNVSDAAKDLITGKDLNGNPVDYVFIAEPALSNAQKKNPKISVYENIQDKYKEKSNSNIIQAGIFVNNDTDIKVINDYLSNLEKRINGLLKDTSDLHNILSLKDEEIVVTKYGISLTVMESVLTNNTVGLGYTKAYDIKEDIDNFLKLLNKDITNEKIYFQ